MVNHSNRLYISIFSIIILLLIPFVAMQFTDEVSWSAFDFVIAGILLLAVAILFDFVFRKVKSKPHRVIIIVIIVTMLLILWAELAVGVFNSPISGQ